MLEHKIVTKTDANTISAMGRRRQVLVVDDNMTIQDVLSRILLSLGYDVTLAGNGLEGGALFVTGSFDLVITDLQMPLMNGWELSRLVKKQAPKTPVIIVSGSFEDKHWEEMNMGCIDAIVPKPFKLKEIEETVRRVLDS